MSRGYLDKRREDRLNERSVTFRNKKLVKRLDMYCALTNTKIIDYVESAVEKQLDFDIDNIQTLIKQDKELKENNYE